MRRAIISLAVATAGALGAGAAGHRFGRADGPFKAKAVPIAGLPPHRATSSAPGAAFESEFKISGTEYGGFPPPLIHVNVYLPAGVKLHTSGFPTCPQSMLEPWARARRPARRRRPAPPARSRATSRSAKKSCLRRATIESFYAPGGGLEFFTFGH